MMLNFTEELKREGFIDDAVMGLSLNSIQPYLDFGSFDHNQYAGDLHTFDTKGGKNLYT